MAMQGSARLLGIEWLLSFLAEEGDAKSRYHGEIRNSMIIIGYFKATGEIFDYLMLIGNSIYNWYIMGVIHDNFIWYTDIPFFLTDWFFIDCNGIMWLKQE